jgi:hypothetical protein
MYGTKLLCTYKSTDAKQTKFYDTVFYGPTATVQTNDIFPLDTTLNQPYQNADARDKYELWPALYEKAYAEKFHQAGNDPCPMNGINWDSNPLVNLWNLTGCGNSTKREANMCIDPAIMVTEIKNRCSSGKTLYPMAIWVKSPLPANTDGAIRPDHTYSVLGHWTKETIEYIVLRDPKGQTVSTPLSPNCLLSGSWTLPDNFRYDCTTRVRTPGGPLTITLGNGIFAIRSTKVGDYFKAVAWAGP